mgnify:CR=1 FL=1
MLGAEGKFLLKAPLCVSIITTNRCNLRCRHCINSATPETHDDSLSTNDIKSIIDQCRISGVETIEFNGGEFFVRADNQELLDYAVNSRMSISITTNGTLIDESWARKYQGKISLLRISLDSHIKSIHDDFRGVHGAFERTTNNIRLLKECGYHITILSTITKSRLVSFGDFLNYIANLGVDGLHTTMLIPAGRGHNLNDEVLTPVQHELFLKQYREYKQKYSNKMAILEESPQTCLLEDYVHDGIPCKCGAAFTEVVVLDDGYVLPCASFISSRDKFQNDDLNIKKRSLIDVYRNSEIMNNVRDIHRLKGKCADCCYLDECGGGCRAAALISFDDIFAPDPLCWK